MTKHKTRLSYLLERVGMRPTDLARQAAVDKAVVSRWRNGKRRFPAAGNVTQRVVCCILQQPNGSAVAERILLAGGYNPAQGSLEHRLALWLSEETLVLPGHVPPVDSSAGSDHYITFFKQYWGLEGLRHAVITLIEYADRLAVQGSPVEIVIVIWGDPAWLEDFPAFAQDLFHALEEAFGRGTKLITARPKDFAPEEVSACASNWLAGALSGNIIVLDLPESAANAKSECFCYGVAKETVGMRLFRLDELPNEVGGSLYTDDISVRHIDKQCQEYMQLGRPRYKLDFFSAPAAPPKTLDIRHSASHSSLICAPLPTFGTIPFQALAQYARVPMRKSAPAFEKLRFMSALPEEYDPQVPVFHMYCREEIERCLKGARLESPEFSALLGAPVYISKKQMLQQLARIKGWLENLPNYRVAFVPQKAFRGNSLAFHVAESCFVVGWVPETGRSLRLLQKAQVEAMYSHARHLWNSLPKSCKNKTESLKMLDEWLA